MAGVIQSYSQFEVRAVGAEVQRGTSQVSECLRPERSEPKGSVCAVQQIKNGRTALNDNPEKQRVRPRTSHTDEDCVIVEGNTEESRLVNRISKHNCALLHSIGKEHYREGML
jgi:hypothetical protein